MGEGNAVRRHKRACVQSHSQRLAEGDMKEEEEEEGLQLLLPGALPCITSSTLPCLPLPFAVRV